VKGIKSTERSKRKKNK